jgi:hypothetical protein
VEYLRSHNQWRGQRVVWVGLGLPWKLAQKQLGIMQPIHSSVGPSRGTKPTQTRCPPRETRAQLRPFVSPSLAASPPLREATSDRGPSRALRPDGGDPPPASHPTSAASPPRASACVAGLCQAPVHRRRACQAAKQLAKPAGGRRVCPDLWALAPCCLVACSLPPWSVV